MKLVVDANIFISALLGGKSAELLFNPNFDLLTTERTTWEVKKYLPQLAEYTEDTSAHLLYLFELIPVGLVSLRNMKRHHRRLIFL